MGTPSLARVGTTPSVCGTVDDRSTQANARQAQIFRSIVLRLARMDGNTCSVAEGWPDGTVHLWEAVDGCTQADALTEHGSEV